MSSFTGGKLRLKKPGSVSTAGFVAAPSSAAPPRLAGVKRPVGGEEEIGKESKREKLALVTDTAGEPPSSGGSGGEGGSSKFREEGGSSSGGNDGRGGGEGASGSDGLGPSAPPTGRAGGGAGGGGVGIAALDTRTPAQRAFDEVQRKRMLEEAKKLASKSHRERVEELNEKLKKAPEHNDLFRISYGGQG